MTDYHYMKIDEEKIECDYLFSYAAEMGIPYKDYRNAYLADTVAKLQNPYAYCDGEED